MLRLLSRFSVRGMLVFMAVAALLFAWVAVPVAQYRNECAAIRRLEDVGASFSTEDISWRLSKWQKRLVEKLGLSQYYQRVTYLHFAMATEPIADGHMADVALLRRVELVDLSRTNISDKGVLLLGNLGNLRQLDLSHTQISDGSGGSLGRMSNLQHLNVSSTEVTDEVLNDLDGLEHLRTIDTRQTSITLKGIARRFPIQTLRNSIAERLDEMGRCGGGGRIFNHHTFWIDSEPKQRLLLDGVDALEDDSHYAFSVGVTSEYCSSDFIGRLADSPSVIALQLDAPALHDDDLLQLTRGKHLRYLAVYQAQLSSRCAKTLVSLPSIEKLILPAESETDGDQSQDSVQVTFSPKDAQPPSRDEFADTCFVFSCRSGARNPYVDQRSLTRAE